ncbi:hypothetical protein [Streptacidiphilus sp. EB129]|uniref:hypothetical protein n=1 Tax=Streptacidiphilus sp. EB129 TaxID=3156262 RepID=UPI0035198375
MTTDGYCRNTLTLAPGDFMPWKPCTECGHTMLVHIGVDHCPVCELVSFAEQQRGDGPAEERGAKVGGFVHLIAPGRLGCIPSMVYRVNPNGTLVLWPCLDAGAYPREITHDETRQADPSWHWRCDGDDQDAEPEPEPSAPTVTVQIHIDGQQ